LENEPPELCERTFDARGLQDGKIQAISAPRGRERPTKGKKQTAEEDGHAESKSSARRRKTARSTVAANDHRKFLQKVTGQNRGILFSSASNKRAPNSVATASQQVT